MPPLAAAQSQQPQIGPTVLGDVPPIEGDGSIEITDPAILQELGYDPSRQWRDGDPVSQVVQVGDVRPIVQDFTGLTTRQIAEYTGVDLNQVPLLGVYGQQTIQGLLERNPELGNVSVEAIPAIASLVNGDFDPAIQSGLNIATQYSPELAQFLQQNPQFGDFPVSAIVKGDWERLLPTAQQQAFQILREQLPEQLQDIPLRSLPAIASIADGDLQTAIPATISALEQLDVISPQSTQAFNDLLNSNPHLRSIPIRELLNGDFQSLLPAAQQVAIAEISQHLPTELQGIPSEAIGPLQELIRGDTNALLDRGIDLAQKELLGDVLASNPALESLNIRQIIDGDFSSVANIATNELAQINPILAEVPLGELLNGNFDAVQRQAVNVAAKATINELLADNPALRDLALGLVGQRYSIEAVPQLADTAISALQGIDAAGIAEIPGLDQVPLELVSSIPNIAAFLQGDLFGKFDFAWGDEDKAYNVISGSTRGRRFKPEPCEVGVTPDTTKCSGIELQDTDGSLNGRYVVLGPNQTVEGGAGLLRFINGGKEWTGWQPWGPRAIEEGSLKLVATSVDEGGGGQAASAQFELRVGFCIDELFVDLGCSPHFIPFPFILHPQVAQDGNILLATNSPAPDIPSNLLRRYRQQYGYYDSPGGGYCYVPPGVADQNEDEYGYRDIVEASQSELVTVSVSEDGNEQKLHQEAAAAFQQLREAAARDGVNVLVWSGHRTEDQQRRLFQVLARREGGVNEALQLLAPHGKSEHHSGFAADLLDGDRPSDTNYRFADTEAYQWLQQNGAEYGWERSYQGTGNSPREDSWHWRYVGSETARQRLNLTTPHSTAASNTGQGSSENNFVGTGFGSEADVANLLLTSLLEGGSEQAQLDVAVSILNRVNSPHYPNTATEVVFAPGQYEPNFHSYPVNSKAEAIARLEARYGSAARGEYERLEQNLNNPERIAQSQQFLRGATDFRGYRLLRNRRQGDPWRGSRADNWFLQESQSVLVAARTLENLGISSGDFEGFNIEGTGAGPGACGAIASNGSIQTVEGNGIATGTFIHPAMGSIFTDYFAHYHPRRGRPHLGVDVADPSGTPGGAIVASDGGTISFVQYDPTGYGHYVIVDHGNGYATLYAHTSPPIVRVGQRVSQGQQIAIQDETGGSTGVHLHFEVRENYSGGFSGTPVDPEQFIRFR